MGNMSLINRMIFPFAPKAALRREQWRQAGLAYIRSAYTAADQSTRSAGWTTMNATAEQLNQGDRDIVRARARDMERNSDIMAAQLLALERNIIGTGIVLQAKIKDAKGNDDDSLNSKIEALWKEWCLPANCEITGRWSFSELQALGVRRRYVDGGMLLLKVYVDNHFYLQLLEVDDLDNSVQTYENRRVIGGLELDSYRRTVAYHIKSYDQWGFLINTQRFPASQVIYMPYLVRPSQVREFSPAASSIARIDDTNELIDAAIEKERVLAHLSAAIESDSNAPVGTLSGLGRGIGGVGRNEDDGLPTELMEQGTLARLRPGEKVAPISHAGSSAVVDPILKTTQRLAGSSAGLSYEVTSRDMSQATYSSARQGQLEDRLTYGQWQKYLIEHCCIPIYQEWLDWVVLSGQLDLPGYYRDPKKYRQHLWITSGWDWIDPLKEVNANAKALETYQTTLQEICASKGKDYQDVLKQRKAELELLKKIETGGDDSGQG